MKENGELLTNNAEIDTIREGKVQIGQNWMNLNELTKYNVSGEDR